MKILQCNLRGFFFYCKPIGLATNNAEQIEVKSGGSMKSLPK